MRRSLHIIALVFATALFLPLPQANAQEAKPTSPTAALRPPFGLSWGETTDRLAALLRSAKATIIERKIVQGRECWTVEGLVQPGLKRTLFYFTNNLLVETELQYEHTDWDASRYEAFMAQIRQNIETRYGIGTLIAQTKGPQADVMQTVIGYQWYRDSTILQLFFYSAERGTDVYRSVSLHYKYKGSN